MLELLSDFAMPMVVLYLVGYGLIKKCYVYDVKHQKGNTSNASFAIHKLLVRR